MICEICKQLCHYMTSGGCENCNGMVQADAISGVFNGQYEPTVNKSFRTVIAQQNAELSRLRAALKGYPDSDLASLAESYVSRVKELQRLLIVWREIGRTAKNSITGADWDATNKQLEDYEP